MTKEEIKAEYSMRDVIGRYGLTPSRVGLVRCPFHKGDREPSMKIYDKDFNCFGCGANGDIFTFVQMMEGVSFKEAFQILGGIYEKPTFASRLAVYRSRKRREMAFKEQERAAAKKDLNNMLIRIYRRYLERTEPYSDVWCDCYNALQYQLYLHGELNGIELR